MKIVVIVEDDSNEALVTYASRFANHVVITVPEEDRSEVIDELAEYAFEMYSPNFPPKAGGAPNQFPDCRGEECDGLCGSIG